MWTLNSVNYVSNCNYNYMYIGITTFVKTKLMSNGPYNGMYRKSSLYNISINNPVDPEYTRLNKQTCMSHKKFTSHRIFYKLVINTYIYKKQASSNLHCNSKVNTDFLYTNDRIYKYPLEVNYSWVIAHNMSLSIFSPSTILSSRYHFHLHCNLHPVCYYGDWEYLEHLAFLQSGTLHRVQSFSSL